MRSEKEARLHKQAKERPSLFQMAGGSREEDEIDDGGNICITPSSKVQGPVELENNKPLR